MIQLQIVRMLGRAMGTLAWVPILGCATWAVGALYFDLPRLRGLGILGLTLAMAAGLILPRGGWKKLGCVMLCNGAVLTWWLTLQPSNERRWLPDVDRTAWAEITGDLVTLHNLRNFDYITETDYIPHWETRTVRLSQLTGIDLAINYWGSPWMAHPIVSFQFADAPPVCFSIETRKEIGESYSAVGGLYRQFELIYIVADERDVIRVRTNFREGEDVYLYRTMAKPEEARERFLDYLTALNRLHAHPRWYNAFTTNCTTSIRTQRATTKRAPWDWRILLNGKGDELVFERGMVETGGLPFAELKQRVHINVAAKAADSAPDFSLRIRKGLPGF